MAMLTNNVREWEPLWRSMLPVDEIFEIVVDSGFVGSRKPEARIYQLTLERIEAPAEACLFVDDVALNCEGARRAGMRAVHFRDNEQAIAEITSSSELLKPSQVGDRRLRVERAPDGAGTETRTAGGPEIRLPVGLVV